MISEHWFDQCFLKLAYSAHANTIHSMFTNLKCSQHTWPQLKFKTLTYTHTHTQAYPKVSRLGTRIAECFRYLEYSAYAKHPILTNTNTTTISNPDTCTHLCTQLLQPNLYAYTHHWYKKSKVSVNLVLDLFIKKL